MHKAVCPLTEPNLPQLQPVCGFQIFRSAISTNGATIMKLLLCSIIVQQETCEGSGLILSLLGKQLQPFCHIPLPLCLAHSNFNQPLILTQARANSMLSSDTILFAHHSLTWVWTLRSTLSEAHSRAKPCFPFSLCVLQGIKQEEKHLILQQLKPLLLQY